MQTKIKVTPHISQLRLSLRAITRVPAFLTALFCCLVACANDAHAQENARYTQGDVNESATLNLGVSLVTYKGRGIDLPISLNYSSTVWNIEVRGKIYQNGVPQTVTEAIFAKHSVSGWKSTLDLPVIEYPKATDMYTYNGKASTVPGTGGCYGNRIARVFVHMPDGSTHELRKSDLPHGGGVDRTGTFYAVDGSRMRFDGDGGLDTGTIYTPDGTRYVIGHPVSQIVDRHGNTLTYNEDYRVWTDTLGRVIAQPLPTVPQVGDFPYSLPGLAGVNGGAQTYIFKWRRLEHALTPNDSGGLPAMRYVASHYLPSPTGNPTNPGGGNFPAAQSNQYGSLFQTAYNYDPDGNPTYHPTIVVGRAEPGGQVFNPVVLTEIVLPDQTKYRFTYNVYGELDKIVYPTSAFERYEYQKAASHIESPYTSEPYDQARRRLNSRKISTDETGSDIRQWKYSDTLTNSTRMVSTIAPDDTRTDVYKVEIASVGGRFGFQNATDGMVIEKRIFSASPGGTGGTMLRRELTEYEQSQHTYNFVIQCGQNNMTTVVTAPRNVRPVKNVSVLFEGSGPALAQTSSSVYDVTHQFSTGVDQTQTRIYHFAVVDNATAQDGAITQIPTGALAKHTDTVFRNDAVYRDANILGLMSLAQIKDAAGNVVSQSEMVYDECPNYCVTAGRGLPTSMKTWDSTKGPATSPSAYLVTHAKFDGYGNRIESTDAKGFITTTVFDSTYHAFPTQVISPVPDPNPSQNPDGLPHGSDSAFVTTTVYDTQAAGQPPMGMVVATIDANGQTTTMEYNDPLLRPTRTVAPSGHQTVTEYGAGTSDATRWVKVRSQIDQEKWSEAKTWYDGLGRTYLSEKTDAQGNLFSETEYDEMGRVKRSTNPYRSGETKHWTTPEYDDLSRTTKVISPDTDDVRIVYGLSTSATIGATKTIIDQAGRERTGISDALGNMVRVYEGPVAQNLYTDYTFDSLGNLRRTSQGMQNRYFLSDSLGRVLFAKQPEQDVNAGFVATDPITGNSAWSVKYTYDDNGNLLTTTDARNISIAGTYDRLNRLVKRDYSDVTPDVGFFYDGTGLPSVPAFSKGKTTKVTSTVSENRNTTFDQMGRLLTSEQRTTDEQRSGIQAPYTFSYVYNLSGSLIQETYPSGRAVRNTLNMDGELSQVQSKKNSSYGFFTYADTFEYNASGAVVRMQLGNGHWESAEYDPKRLQITRLGLGLTATDQNLFRLEFQYNSDGQTDNNGSMRLQRISVPSVGGNPGFTATQSYFYDSLNRLRSAVETVSGNQTWQQSFFYDRYGNRRFDSAATTTLGSCPSSVCNPEISPATNRFLTGEGYMYDLDGSLVRDAGGNRYGYDAENRQKEFFSAANQTSSPDATYAYDGEGRRVKTMVGNAITIFVYDAGGQLAAEYSTSVTPVERARVSYLTADHLGSPRVITDQRGAVVSRKDFGAFGEEIVTPQRVGGANGNGYDPPNVRQDYTGYERDNESGLEFAQARYYNAGHGRFTTVDPATASATIRNPQTLNRYSYALNSPYKFTDPLGLFPMGGAGCGRGRCITIVGDSWWTDNVPFQVTASGQLSTSGQQGSDSQESGGQPTASTPKTPPEASTDSTTASDDTPPPQHLLAEAINRIQHVILIPVGSEGASIPGILSFDEATNTEITNALGTAYENGVSVGALAATTSGVTVLSSITNTQSSSVGPSVSVSLSGPSAGVSGSGAHGMNRTQSVSSADAIRKDQTARSDNATLVDRTATRLEGVQLSVSTARGAINVVPGRAFWKESLTREVDLIYRRGVEVGNASANRSPAIRPRK